MIVQLTSVPGLTRNLFAGEAPDQVRGEVMVLAFEAPDQVRCMGARQ